MEPVSIYFLLLTVSFAWTFKFTPEQDFNICLEVDKEKRERIDVKNQSETLVYQAEKQLSELGDKVDSDAKAKVEEKRIKLKEATEKDDLEQMKLLLEDLQKELYSLGASVYQQAGSPGGVPGSDEASTSQDGQQDAGDDVIDAEFTESK